MSLAIKNVNGTSDNKCKCGSWLDHWKKYGKQNLPTYCCEALCIEAPAVGAHVQKSTITDNSWYIIPLCHKHNKASNTLSVVDSTTFVTANRGGTCGY